MSGLMSLLCTDSGEASITVFAKVREVQIVKVLEVISHISEVFGSCVTYFTSEWQVLFVHMEM